MSGLSFSRFKLEKLYFDLIDKDGNCFILYWAKLHWWFFKFTYSGILFSNSSDHTYEKSSLKKIIKPTGTDNTQFDHPDLQFKGQWIRLDPAVSLLLYKDEWKHSVFWNCYQPKSRAEIKFKNQSYQGLGYTESILLEIQPWKLPIYELKWGRFLSDNYCVIWIQWQGEHPLNKLFCNGQLYEDAVFENNIIKFNQDQFKLEFLDPTIIRSGSLAEVLSSMPWFKMLFKKSVLNTIERKCKSITRFYQREQLVERGWSIFETVIWNK
jgi:hypothetical protein